MGFLQRLRASSSSQAVSHPPDHNTTSNTTFGANQSQSLGQLHHHDHDYDQDRDLPPPPLHHHPYSTPHSSPTVASSSRLNLARTITSPNSHNINVNVSPKATSKTPLWKRKTKDKDRDKGKGREIAGVPYEQMGNSSIGGQGQGQGQMMASRSMPLGVDGSGSEPGSGPGPGYERRGSYSGIPDSRSGYDPSGRAGPGVGSGSRPGFGQSRAPPSSWGRSDLAMGDRSYSEYGQHAGTLDTPSPGYRGSSYGKDAEDDTERTPRKNRVSSGTFKQDGGILGRLTFESELELSQDGSPGRLFMEGVGTGGDSGPYRDRIHEGGSPRSLASSVRPSKAASPTHSPSYAVPSPERRGRQIAPPRLSLSTDPAVPLQRVNATQPEAIQGGEVENLISPKKEKEKEKKFWQGRRSSRRMSTTSILSDRSGSPTPRKSASAHVPTELTPASPSKQPLDLSTTSQNRPQIRRPSSFLHNPFNRSSSRLAAPHDLDASQSGNDSSFRVTSFRHVSGVSESEVHEWEGFIQSSQNINVNHARKTSNLEPITTSTLMTSPQSSAPPSSFPPVPPATARSASRPPSRTTSQISLDDHITPATKVSAAAFRKAIRRPSEVALYASGSEGHAREYHPTDDDALDTDDDDDVPLGVLDRDRRSNSAQSLTNLRDALEFKQSAKPPRAVVDISRVTPIPSAAVSNPLVVSAEPQLRRPSPGFRVISRTTTPEIKLNTERRANSPEAANSVSVSAASQQFASAVTSSDTTAILPKASGAGGSRHSPLLIASPISEPTSIPVKGYFDHMAPRATSTNAPNLMPLNDLPKRLVSPPVDAQLPITARKPPTPAPLGLPTPRAVTPADLVLPLRPDEMPSNPSSFSKSATATDVDGALIEHGLNEPDRFCASPDEDAGLDERLVLQSMATYGEAESPSDTVTSPHDQSTLQPQRSHSTLFSFASSDSIPKARPPLSERLGQIAANSTSTPVAQIPVIPLKDSSKRPPLARLSTDNLKSQASQPQFRSPTSDSTTSPIGPRSAPVGSGAARTPSSAKRVIGPRAIGKQAAKRNKANWSDSSDDEGEHASKEKAKSNSQDPPVPSSRPASRVGSLANIRAVASRTSSSSLARAGGISAASAPPLPPHSSFRQPPALSISSADSDDDDDDDQDSASGSGSGSSSSEDEPLTVVRAKASQSNLAVNIPPRSAAASPIFRPSSITSSPSIGPPALPAGSRQVHSQPQSRSVSHTRQSSSIGTGKQSPLHSAQAMDQIALSLKESASVHSSLSLSTGNSSVPQPFTPKEESSSRLNLRDDDPQKGVLEGAGQQGESEQLSTRAAFSLPPSPKRFQHSASASIRPPGVQPSFPMPPPGSMPMPMSPGSLPGMPLHPDQMDPHMRTMMKQAWQAQYMAAALRASEDEWERASAISGHTAPNPSTFPTFPNYAPSHPPFMGYGFPQGFPGPPQGYPPFAPPPGMPMFGMGMGYGHGHGLGQGQRHGYGYGTASQSVFGGEFGPPSTHLPMPMQMPFQQPPLGSPFPTSASNSNLHTPSSAELAGSETGSRCGTFSPYLHGNASMPFFPPTTYPLPPGSVAGVPPSSGSGLRSGSEYGSGRTSVSDVSGRGRGRERAWGSSKGGEREMGLDLNLDLDYTPPPGMGGSAANPRSQPASPGKSRLGPGGVRTGNRGGAGSMESSQERWRGQQSQGRWRDSRMLGGGSEAGGYAWDRGSEADLGRGRNERGRGGRTTPMSMSIVN